MAGDSQTDIEIALTREQQTQLLMSAGFILRSIRVRKVRLAALALAAAAAGSESLPFSRSAQTISRMLQAPGEPSSGPFLRIINLPLTPEQTDSLRQLTGRRLSSLMLAPDEYELNCRESWASDAGALAVSKSFVVVREGSTDATGDGHHHIVLPDDKSQSVFGTGRHAATQLALVLMEEHLRAGMTVIDVGTGSGILAVAACRLGAASVTAVDNDPAAVVLAERTVALNGLSDRIDVRSGTLTGSHRMYDMVVMNIGAGAIISLAGAAADLLPDSGCFITSGIAASRADDVVAAAITHGFHLVDTQAKGDWRGIAFIKVA